MSLPTACDLIADLRSGRRSSEALVRELLDRIARVNPRVNAVITLDAEGALARARAADAARREGRELGPLHGLPMTVKDSLDVAGMRAVNGAPAQRDHVPVQSAVAVQRLLNAGAIVIGKTNVPLYSLNLQTFNEVFGVTHNPWDPARTPGGSSGGAAAALATGMAHAEIGSDLAGSLRVPAHCCGVCALKPSFGLIPTTGAHAGPPGARRRPDMTVVGPLARSVADLRLLFGVMAGPDSREEGAWQLHLRNPVRPVAAMRVAVWADSELCPVEPGVAAAVETVAAGLERAGCIIDRAARPAFEPRSYFRNFLRLMYGEMGGDFPEPLYRAFALAARRPDPGDAWTPLTVMPAAVAQTHREWLGAVEERERYRELWVDFFSRYDVLLTPVSPFSAPLHDHRPFEERTITLRGQQFAYMQQSFWCGLATGAYLPAVAVPAGRDPAGLPVGVQVIGPYLADYTALACAEFIEQLTGGFQPPPL